MDVAKGKVARGEIALVADEVGKGFGDGARCGGAGRTDGGDVVETFEELAHKFLDKA